MAIFPQFHYRRFLLSSQQFKPNSLGNGLINALNCSLGGEKAHGERTGQCSLQGTKGSCHLELLTSQSSNGLLLTAYTRWFLPVFAWEASACLESPKSHYSHLFHLRQSLSLFCATLHRSSSYKMSEPSEQHRVKLQAPLIMHPGLSILRQQVFKNFFRMKAFFPNHLASFCQCLDADISK